MSTTLKAAETSAYPDAARAAYREAGFWTEETLPAAMLRAGAQHDSNMALVTAEVAWTHGELWARSRTFAAGLLSRTKVRPGDAVMFQMGNVAETVVCYLGCLLAGARPVCTLPQHGAREIGLLAQHLGAGCLITQVDFGRGGLPAVAEALVSSGAISEVVSVRGDVAGATSYDQLMAAGERADTAHLPYLDLDPGEIAVFQLSGGTTGLPKVAPRLHEEYAYNARAWAEALGWGPGDAILYTLPLMHNAGLALALQPILFSGSTLVLAPSADIATLLDFVQVHRPRAIPLVPPAVAIRLLEEPAARGVDFSGLVDFIVGGQRLPVEIAERLRDELDIHVRQMFGMAEGMFLLTPCDAGEYVRHHTVGAPLSPGDEVRVLIPGTEDEVAPGEVGEFCARGPYTIRGYYRADQHNLANFTSDGLYRSGDLARRHDIDGTAVYSIDGRIKDVINRGVEKIFAEEIEELIVRQAGVATVAVVAMPDEVLGERACAYVVMEPGATALTVESLGEFLQAQGLAKYKLPERVEIVPALPLTNVGKVSKKDLRFDIASKIDRERSGA